MRIENGSGLWLTHGLKMEGGSLVTLAALDGPGKVAATQGLSLIFGDVTITGGDVMMNANLGKGGLDNTDADTLAGTFSNILILGSLDWSGGRYVAFVNTSTFKQDSIVVFGTDCSISKDVTFSIGSSNTGADWTDVPADKIFPLVVSANAITGAPTLTGSVAKFADIYTTNSKSIGLIKK